jgi:NADPH:quinone reductase-like Zn-dependent oxidoreductase
MKAIVQERYGPLDTLTLRDVPKPTAGDGEVLVKVRATSVHADVWHAVRGEPYALRFMGSGVRRPRTVIPGTDLAGIVESVGPFVTQFRPGDAVYGECVGVNQWRNGGSFAEYVAVPAKRLAPMPARLSYEQAAAVPTSASIALGCLRDEGRIRAGQRVLINGAGGAVGTFAVQLAHACGAHVTAVDSTEKLDMLRAIGADRVLDYKSDDYTQETTGVLYDLVLDIAGNHPFSRCRRVLAPTGTYVLVGHDHYGATGRKWMGSLGTFFSLMVRSAFVKQLPGLRGAKAPNDRFAVVSEMVADGDLIPVVDRTYPLSEAPAALRYLTEEHTRGKIVLTVGDPPAQATE